MKLTFLGTAAANAFPEAFCRCENCEGAHALGGHSLRKRSAALINDDLLIDLGPDIMTADQMHNCPLTNVRYCLQTHAHSDHLDPSHFLSRSPGFGVVGAHRLQFYASPASLRKTALTFKRDLSADKLLDPATGDKLNLELHPLNPWQSFDIGSYHLTAIPAITTPVWNCCSTRSNPRADVSFMALTPPNYPKKPGAVLSKTIFVSIS